jgi:hypothetical protein
MIQRRLLSFVFILLFAFAQQQALVHPYVHLTNEQGSSSPQNNSTSNKQNPSTFELAIEVVQSYSSSTNLAYHSRAPPTLA